MSCLWFYFRYNKTPHYFIISKRRRRRRGTFALCSKYANSTFSHVKKNAMQRTDENLFTPWPHRGTEKALNTNIWHWTAATEPWKSKSSILSSGRGWRKGAFKGSIRTRSKESKVLTMRLYIEHSLLHRIYGLHDILSWWIQTVTHVKAAQARRQYGIRLTL